MNPNKPKNRRSAWREYRPSKTLWFWSAVGLAVLTVATGFAAGGWVSTGVARDMAQQAAGHARAKLVAEVCVQRFIHADGFADRFAKLKHAGTFKREDLIEEGPWTDLPGVKGPVAGAARRCANELACMAIPNNPADKNALGIANGS